MTKHHAVTFVFYLVKISSMRIELRIALKIALRFMKKQILLVLKTCSINLSEFGNSQYTDPYNHKTRYKQKATLEKSMKHVIN